MWYNFERSRKWKCTYYKAKNIGGNKMKTKFLKTAAAVMAMVMCLGMTAFAAPSPSGSDFVVGGISRAVDADGNDISGMLEVTELPNEYAMLQRSSAQRRDSGQLWDRIIMRT